VTWVCDIPGADPTTATLHVAVHLSLTVFVVVAGVVFLALATVAYRRSDQVNGSPQARPATD
jgi:uncharacterized membrane protein YidH (DUF202 family)